MYVLIGENETTTLTDMGDLNPLYYSTIKRHKIEDIAGNMFIALSSLNASNAQCKVNLNLLGEGVLSEYSTFGPP